MKVIGRVQGSAQQAKPLVVDKDTVYVHTDIKVIKTDEDGTELYEYQEVQYDKDEYGYQTGAKVLELEQKLKEVNDQNVILMMAVSDLFNAVLGGAKQ